MALLKKIIKSDPREVIVKWTGSGADTLTLASLVSTGQTVDGVLPLFVTILSVSASLDTAGICTITRNAQEVLHVHDHYEFQTNGIIQAVLNENGGSDIVVNLATAGTLIMRVKKTQGYTGI